MSAEEDSLPCSLGSLCAMPAIQDSLPFHPYQYDAGAEAVHEVSLAVSWNDDDEA